MNTSYARQRATNKATATLASALAPAPQAKGQYDWRDDALCAQSDPDAFSPETGQSSVAAQKICASCDVRERCLEYALANDERFGVWGGLSAKQRRRLLKLAAAA